MTERRTLNRTYFCRGSSANLPCLHTCENKVPFWDFSSICRHISVTCEKWLSLYKKKCFFFLFQAIKLNNENKDKQSFKRSKIFEKKLKVSNHHQKKLPVGIVYFFIKTLYSSTVDRFSFDIIFNGLCYVNYR